MTIALVLPDSRDMYNSFHTLKHLCLCPDKLTTTGYFTKIFAEFEFYPFEMS